jgi:hypothetical protein
VDWGNDINGEYVEVWIEDPCPPNPGTVTEVYTTEELIDVLKTVGAGNTIKLAGGLYEPPVALWTIPGLGDRKMSLLANGVTLDGENTSGARIRIAGDYGGLFTSGTVVLKNLTIEDDGGLPGVGVPGIYGTQGNLTVCNVDIEGVGYGDGVFFAPWTGGSHTLKVINSTITTMNSDNYDYADGIYLEACNAGPGGSSINAEIKETIIKGWRDGVVWFDCGFTAVNVDCAGISGNQFFNAVRWLDTSPSDTPVEYCPK